MHGEQLLLSKPDNDATDGYDDNVEIIEENIRPVNLEIAFEGHYPVEKKMLSLNKPKTKEADNVTSFEFEGIGFVVIGSISKWFKDGYDNEEESYTLHSEMYVDGELVTTSYLPNNYTTRKNTLFWKYQLPKGKHTVKIIVLNANEEVGLNITEAIIYDNKPNDLKY